MTGAVLQREFVQGLAEACAVFEKLTGAPWSVESVTDGAGDVADEEMEAVRIGVSGLISPRFLLAAPGPDASRFAKSVSSASGLGLSMDVLSVLCETANIVVSAILHQMNVGSGQALIVTVPQPLRGLRAELLRPMGFPRGAGIARARFVSEAPVAARLDLIAIWDA